MNSSATIHEYPLVADVDGDGEAELLVVANQSDPIPAGQLRGRDARLGLRQGVFSYGAGSDQHGSRRASSGRSTPTT
jgi:hypothetical protein